MDSGFATKIMLKQRARAGEYPDSNRDLAATFPGDDNHGWARHAVLEIRPAR
jgi:hypothetical protein